MIGKQHPKQQTEIKSIDTPGEAEKLCLRLIDTTADLISVLEQETQLVKKAMSDDFTALTVRKQALSVMMMKDMDILKTNSTYIKMAVPEQVSILKEQQDHFHRSLAINHRAISAMKAVSEELLQTIADKTAKKKGGPTTYNNNAAYNNSDRKTSRPVALDTSL